MGIENRKVQGEERELKRHPEGILPEEATAARDAETTGMQAPGELPVPVFDRVAELEQQVEALQAKLDRQRELARVRNQRWRERHLDEVRQRGRERTRAYRARKRRTESADDSPEQPDSGE